MFILKTLPAELPEKAPSELATVQSIVGGGAEKHVLRDKENLGLICRNWCESSTSEWMVSWSHMAMPGLVYQAPYYGPKTVLPGGRLVSASGAMYAQLVDAFKQAKRDVMEAEIQRHPFVRSIEPLLHASGFCPITGNVATHVVNVATCWSADMDAVFMVADGEHLQDHAALLARLMEV